MKKKKKLFLRGLVFSSLAIASALFNDMPNIRQGRILFALSLSVFIALSLLSWSGYYSLRYAKKIATIKLESIPDTISDLRNDNKGISRNYVLMIASIAIFVFLSTFNATTINYATATTILIIVLEMTVDYIYDLRLLKYLEEQQV